MNEYAELNDAVRDYTQLLGGPCPGVCDLAGYAQTLRLGRAKLKAKLTAVEAVEKAEDDKSAAAVMSRLEKYMVSTMGIPAGLFREWGPVNVKAIADRIWDSRAKALLDADAHRRAENTQYVKQIADLIKVRAEFGNKYESKEPGCYKAYNALLALEKIDNKDTAAKLTVVTEAAQVFGELDDEVVPGSWKAFQTLKELRDLLIKRIAEQQTPAEAPKEIELQAGDFVVVWKYPVARRERRGTGRLIRECPVGHAVIADGAFRNWVVEIDGKQISHLVSVRDLIGRPSPGVSMGVSVVLDECAVCGEHTCDHVMSAPLWKIDPQGSPSVEFVESDIDPGVKEVFTELMREHIIAEEQAKQALKEIKQAFDAYIRYVNSPTFAWDGHYYELRHRFMKVYLDKALLVNAGHIEFDAEITDLYLKIVRQGYDYNHKQEN